MTSGAKLHLVKLVRYEPWLLSAIIFDLLDRSETLITNASSSTLDDYALEIQVQFLQGVDHDHNRVEGHIYEAHSDECVAEHDSISCIDHIAEKKQKHTDKIDCALVEDVLVVYDAILPLHF